MFAYSTSSPISIVNSGNIRTKAQNGSYSYSFGINVFSIGNSPITINNSGSIYAEGGADTLVAGIHSSSPVSTTIINSRDIGASSQNAISVSNGAANIFNTGTINGYVLLDANDTFINQAGGEFEARQTSNFDAYGAGGTDLFRNEQGGTVHVDGSASFVNLETFKNQGLISLVDGGKGDSFTISNTGSANINFVASGNSTLAVDAFLGGPSNSSSDQFIVQGNVSGTTTVQINNTNAGPGVFNTKGIKLVTVTGKTPSSNAFKLDQPIDTGFFNYDLFFTPTGSGFWSLKSFPGGGLCAAATPHRGAGHLAPDLVHLVRPHRRSSRAVEAPTAHSPGGRSLRAAPAGNLAPAVWARGSGNWLQRNDSASTSACGRTYNYNLDRDLQTTIPKESRTPLRTALPGAPPPHS